MKKIIFSLIVTITLIIFPNNIKASGYGIENFYIDAKVLENGDLHVKELFDMNGEFNGFERIINYKNINAKLANGTFADLTGSTLYNGNNIKIVKIQGIKIDDSFSFDSINKNGDLFEKVSGANSGDRNVYTEQATAEGKKIKIYNPSREKKAFYIEYVIENIGIVHNDVAEIGWNIFSDQLVESIANLEMKMTIPNNKDLLRVWAHGPLWGETKIVNNQQFNLNITGLLAKQAIDTRFVFDKVILSGSTKNSGITALDEIIRIETDLADKANQRREEDLKRLENLALMAVEQAEKKVTQENYNWALKTVNNLPNTSTIKKDLFKRLELVEKKLTEKKQISAIVNGIWALGLIWLVFKTSKKRKEEKKTSFDAKYYREMPTEYGPEIASYLISKQIGSQALSSSILYLISKKAIIVEPINESDDKKDYYLIKSPEALYLRSNEEELLDFIFADGEKITLSSFKKSAKSGYEKFMKNYTKWVNSSKTIAKDFHFFEKTKVGASILYVILGLLLAAFPLTGEDFIGIKLATVIISIIMFIYLLSYIKRSEKGKEDYAKLISLKRFLTDFGNFDTKDLPDMILWEQYLAYATVFGIAKKLSKTMELKIKEMEEIGYFTNHPTYYNYMLANHMVDVSNQISSGVNQALSSAQSSYNSAHSSSSSGSGFGGGFSGGGGSFGGGGGGGRF